MTTFLLEEDHTLPLCRIQVTVQAGATTDAQGKTIGLCNFATELMRRGAGGKSRAALDQELDRLGASLSVLCSHDAVTFDLLALKEKLTEALPLLADVLLRPHFDETEATLLRRELLASLDELRDDDSSLVGRFFSRALFSPHPYGNPVEGTAKTIPLLQVKAAKTWYQEQIFAQNLIFGAAGDISESELQDLFHRFFSSLPTRAYKEPITPFLSHPPKQLRVLLLDKPDRTQSQILLGQIAPSWNDPAWLPLSIASTAFGGTFTARLMDEVRVKRGLSYGASASLGKGKSAQGLIVHVFPSAEQTAETIDLVLKLYNEWATGLRPDEIAFAKSYLAKSYAFAIQTPESRLRRRTQLELCGMPKDHIHDFPARVNAVSEKQINQVLMQKLTPQHLLITLLATADFMKPKIQSLSSLSGANIEVIPYDAD